MIVLYIAARVTAGERNWRWFALFGVITAVCVTVKVTALAVAFFAAMWIVLTLWTRDEKRSTLLFAASAFTGVIIGIIWLMWAMGGLNELAWVFQQDDVFHTHPISQFFSMEFEGGPPVTLLVMLWQISAIVTVSAAVGLVWVFSGKSKDVVSKNGEHVPALFALFVLLFLLMPIMLPHRLNLRYIAAACGSGYLLGGIGLYIIIRKIAAWIQPLIRPQVTMLGMAVFLTFFAALNYDVVAGKHFADLSAKDILPRDQQVDPATIEAHNLGLINLAKALVYLHPIADHYVSLTGAYYQAGRFQDCISTGNQALTVYPNDARLYSNLCAAYNKLGRFADGRVAGERAVQLDPTYERARKNLAISIRGMSGPHATQ
jgi:hypothetical protein